MERASTSDQLKAVVARQALATGAWRADAGDPKAAEIKSIWGGLFMIYRPHFVHHTRWVRGQPKIKIWT